MKNLHTFFLAALVTICIGAALHSQTPPTTPVAIAFNTFQGQGHRPQITPQLPHTIPECPTGKHMDQECLATAQAHFYAKVNKALDDFHKDQEQAQAIKDGAEQECQDQYDYCVSIGGSGCAQELQGCKNGALWSYMFAIAFAQDKLNKAHNTAEAEFDIEALECCVDD